MISDRPVGIPVHLDLIVIEENLSASVVLAHRVEEKGVLDHLGLGLKGVWIFGVWYRRKQIPEIRKQLELKSELQLSYERITLGRVVEHLQSSAGDRSGHSWYGAILDSDVEAIEFRMNMRSIDGPASAEDGIRGVYCEASKVAVGRKLGSEPVVQRKVMIVARPQQYFGRSQSSSSQEYHRRLD